MRDELADAVEQWAEVARRELADYQPDEQGYAERSDILQVLLIFHAALVSNRVDLLAKFMGERIEEEIATIQKMKSAGIN